MALSALATCSAPKNAIETENCLPGNPLSDWYVDGVGATIFRLYHGQSVNVGQTIFFKIQTNASAYRIDAAQDITRDKERLVASMVPSATLPQVQPACLTDSSTGLTDCGNWGISASWAVPSTAVSESIPQTHSARYRPSGLSFCRAQRFRPFRHFGADVRPTWQAYNIYGGSSLYGPTIRAFKVG
jgi:hypothetical protein